MKRYTRREFISRAAIASLALPFPFSCSGTGRYRPAISEQSSKLPGPEGTHNPGPEEEEKQLTAPSKDASGEHEDRILLKEYQTLGIDVNLDPAFLEKPGFLFRSEGFERSYNVVAGMSEYPTPEGEFLITGKVHNPKWIIPLDSEWVRQSRRYQEYISTTDNITEDSRVFVPYGHELHPLGPWKLRFTSYHLIHGNRAEKVGKDDWYRSTGCIRMRNRDINDLSEHIETGTPVRISYSKPF